MADFQTLSEAELVDSDRNDADSFDVKVNGDVRNFRLYFTDAPETDFRFPERIKNQAASFGVRPSEVPDLGKKAKARASEILKNEKFEVITRGEMAQGKDGQMSDRAFAVVRFPEKAGTDEEFLAQRLVKEGLARPGGIGADIGGRPEAAVRSELAALSPLKPTVKPGKVNIGFTPQQLTESEAFKSAPAERKVKLIDEYFSRVQDEFDRAFPKGSGVQNDAITMTGLRDGADRLIIRELLKDETIPEEEVAEIIASRAFPERSVDLDENASVFIRPHFDPRKRDQAQVIVQDKTSNEARALDIPRAEILDKGIGQVLFENRDALAGTDASGSAVSNAIRNVGSGLVGDFLGGTIKGLAVTLGGDEESKAFRVGKALSDLGDEVVARGTLKGRLRQFAPSITERLPTTVARGAGQLAGALVTGGVTAGASKTAAATVMAGTSYGQITSEAYTQARALGADDDSARSAAITAGIVGAPIETAANLTLLKLMGVRGIAAAGHNGGFMHALGSIAAGVAVEGATEAAQTASSNAVLAAQISDSVKLGNGVLEAGVIGGLLGGGVGGVGAISKKLRELEPEVRDAVIKDIDSVKATAREKERLIKDSEAEIEAASGLSAEQLGELQSLKAFDQLVKDTGSEVNAFEYLGTYQALRADGLISDEFDGTQIKEEVDRVLDERIAEATGQVQEQGAPVAPEAQETATEATTEPQETSLESDLAQARLEQALADERELAQETGQEPRRASRPSGPSLTEQELNEEVAQGRIEQALAEERELEPDAFDDRTRTRRERFLRPVPQAPPQGTELPNRQPALPNRQPALPQESRPTQEARIARDVVIPARQADLEAEAEQIRQQLADLQPPSDLPDAAPQTNPNEAPSNERRFRLDIELEKPIAEWDIDFVVQEINDFLSRPDPIGETAETASILVKEAGYTARQEGGRTVLTPPSEPSLPPQQRAAKEGGEQLRSDEQITSPPRTTIEEQLTELSPAQPAESGDIKKLRELREDPRIKKILREEVRNILLDEPLLNPALNPNALTNVIALTPQEFINPTKEILAKRGISLSKEQTSLLSSEIVAKITRIVAGDLPFPQKRNPGPELSFQEPSKESEDPRGLTEILTERARAEETQRGKLIDTDQGTSQEPNQADPSPAVTIEEQLVEPVQQEPIIEPEDRPEQLPSDEQLQRRATKATARVKDIDSAIIDLDKKLKPGDIIALEDAFETGKAVVTTEPTKVGDKFRTPYRLIVDKQPRAESQQKELTPKEVREEIKARAQRASRRIRTEVRVEIDIKETKERAEAEFVGGAIPEPGDPVRTRRVTEPPTKGTFGLLSRLPSQIAGGRTEDRVSEIAGQRVSRILGAYRPEQLAIFPLEEFAEIVEKDVLLKPENFSATDTDLYVGDNPVGPLPAKGTLQERLQKAVRAELRTTNKGSLNAKIRQDAFSRYWNARAQAKASLPMKVTQTKNAENGDVAFNKAADFARDLETFFRKKFPPGQAIKGRFQSDLEEGGRSPDLASDEVNARFDRLDVKDVSQELPRWSQKMSDYLDRISTAARNGITAYNATIQEVGEGPQVTEADVTQELMALLDLSKGLPQIDRDLGIEATANAVSKKDVLFAEAFRRSPLDPQQFAAWVDPELSLRESDFEGPEPVNREALEVIVKTRKGTDIYKRWMPSADHASQDWDNIKIARDLLSHTQQKLYGAYWDTAWSFSRKGRESKGITVEGSDIDLNDPVLVDAVIPAAARQARMKWVTNADVGISENASQQEWEDAVRQNVLESIQLISNVTQEYLSDAALESGIQGATPIYESEYGTENGYFVTDPDADISDEHATSVTPEGRETTNAVAEMVNGVRNLFNDIRANKVTGKGLSDFIKKQSKNPDTTTLLGALDKVVNLNGVRVRYANMSAGIFGVARRSNTGAVDIVFSSNLPRSAKQILHSMAEELVHSASYLTNVSEGIAMDAIAKVRQGLPRKFNDLKNLNREQLRQAYMGGNSGLSKSEYVNLYALTSPQETIAHSVISPSFRKLMEDTGVDVDQFVESNFGPEVAAAANNFSKGWVDNARARETQAAASAAIGREPRTAPTDLTAATTQEQSEAAKKAKSVDVDALKGFLARNKGKNILGSRPFLSQEESKLFSEKGEQMATILAEADITNDSDDALKARYKYAVLSLYDSAVNPKAAWNFTNEIVGNTLAQRAARIAAGQDVGLSETGTLSQSLITTRAFARNITKTAEGEAAVMEFWKGIDRGMSDLSGGGRSAHKARQIAFEEAEQRVRKQHKLNPLSIRRALAANQLLSMLSEEDMLRNNDGDLTLQEMEKLSLRSNLASQRESIRAKRLVNRNERRRRDEAQLDEEILNEVESIAKKGSFAEAEAELKRILTSGENAYRQAMVDEFSKLRPEFRFITEVGRGKPWENIRSYLPIVVDNPNTNIYDGSKDVGRDISSDHLVDEEGGLGQMDTGTVGTTISSASLLRRGLAPNGHLFYRSMSQSSLGAAYASQSYEIATLSDRQATQAATRLDYNSKRDGGKLAPLFDNQNPDIQSKNVSEATRLLALKAYQHDRSGIPTGPVSDVIRFFTKMAYYNSLVGVVQPMVQIGPGFLAWLGSSTGDGAISKGFHYFGALRETITLPGQEPSVFDQFINKHAPFFATRTANADKEAQTAREARLLPSLKNTEDWVSREGLRARKISNATLGALEKYFVTASNIAIGVPEKAFLKPLLLVEYRRNAIANKTAKGWNDDSILTDNVDIKALDAALEVVDNIAAPSDTANRGSAFIPQGNGSLGEMGKLALLAFAGHQSAMASQGATAYYDLFRGGDKIRGLRSYSNLAIQGMAYSALYAFIAGALQDLFREEAAEAMGALGFENEKTLAKIQERQENRADMDATTRVMGAAYTGLDDASFPMIPGVGPILSTPLGTAATGATADALKEKYGGSDNFWGDLGNMSYQGESGQIEKMLSVAGPGGEMASDFFHSPIATISTLFIPDRALRDAAKRTIEETLADE